MAKKSSKATMVNHSKWQVRKGLFVAKVRTLRRIITAKHFLYIDKNAMVGAFSNEDVIKYTERFTELVDMTTSTLQEIKNEMKGGKARKETSEFSDMLEKVTKAKKSK